MSLENKIVDYAENKDDIIHWVTLKGEYRYISIINFLKNKNIECSWKNITNYMRYDKLILINSFKYLVVLEELYKSFIKKYFPKKKISNMNFKSAYSKYISLGSKASYDDVVFKKMNQYSETINDFRNKVVHNNILINRMFKGSNLEHTLRKFISILPKSYREKFIFAINECAKGLVENTWHIAL